MTACNVATPPAVDAGVQRLVRYYETLSPEQLQYLPSCYAPQARFKDPFNDVQGVQHIAAIFSHMFDTLDAPRFVVTEQLVQGHKAFLAWEFHFCMRRWRKGQAQCIEGSTLLHFDAQGLVLAHRDYWDAAQELYEKLPVLGAVMRRLRRAGAAPAARTQ